MPSVTGTHNQDADQPCVDLCSNYADNAIKKELIQNLTFVKNGQPLTNARLDAATTMVRINHLFHFQSSVFDIA